MDAWFVGGRKQSICTEVTALLATAESSCYTAACPAAVTINTIPRLHAHLLLSCVMQGSAKSSSAHPAILEAHGFTELAHLVSDSPELQASLHWVSACQSCLQLQSHAQQCFTAEVLPVLMAHYVSGLGPSTAQVRVCFPLPCTATSCSTIFAVSHTNDDLTTGATSVFA